MDIKIIGIIGAGTMGGGIAQVAAQSGYEVVLKDVSEEYVRAGFAKIKERLAKRVGEGKLENHEKDRILSNIKTTASLKDCKDADLIIEAVIEKEDIKKQFFKEMDILCDKETLFATNTSLYLHNKTRRHYKKTRTICRHAFHEPCIHNESLWRSLRVLLHQKKRSV